MFYYFFTTFLLFLLAYPITNGISWEKGIGQSRKQIGNLDSHGAMKFGGLLASWDSSKSDAQFIVSQDGSGNFNTINDAVTALAKLGYDRPERAVIYVRSGTYNENVEITLENVMFVGDGMGKTIITGSLNAADGTPTFNTCTFGVSANGFWARDITFENTAGPEKGQAVAVRVDSDKSVFYRCSFMGFQDTLLVHQQRQFYRDCEIYGTVDFIFGDATAVFQNCDILVRKPLDGQSIVITAQGRDVPGENSGISIINSRLIPADDFASIKDQYKVYLGRPWKMYSRTVFMKTDMDAMIDSAGWLEMRGDYALSTLYYAEYDNTGDGASTANRVKWPGYHVLCDSHEANAFSVRNFIDGDSWLMDTGVPFS